MDYFQRIKNPSKDNLKMNSQYTEKRAGFLILNEKNEKLNKRNKFTVNTLNDLKLYKFKLYIFLNIFILINEIVPINSESFISITVDGDGTQTVINSNYIEKIQILYNGETFESTNEVNVSANKSIKIRIKEEITLITCDNMFDNLSNIITVDLTYFNSSQVQSMRYMFNNGINIKNITIPTGLDM